MVGQIVDHVNIFQSYGTVYTRTVHTPASLPTHYSMAMVCMYVFCRGGALELSPNPFDVWQDALSLLVPNSSSNGSSRRHLLQARSKRSGRVLLQSASTGMVPVQGRVSIRESGSAESSISGSNGTEVLDNTGDIMVIGDHPPMAPATDPASTNNSSKVPTPPAQGTAPVAGDNTDGAPGPLPSISLPDISVKPKVLLILTAILAPTAVAICTVGVVAGVLYRRRKRKGEEEQRCQQPAATAAANPTSSTAAVEHAAAAAEATAGASGGGPAPGSSVCQRWPSVAENSQNNFTSGGHTEQQAPSYGNNRGTLATPPKEKKGKRGAQGVPSATQLDCSNVRSWSQSSSAPQLQPDGITSASNIEFIDPGELAGSSSGDGANFHAMLHPRTDSVDMFSRFEPGVNPRQQSSLRNRFGSLAGSIAGAASSFTAAISHFRSSQAGAAYKVPNKPAAAGSRGPTLPGSYGASHGLPELAAAAATSTAAAAITGAKAQQQHRQLKQQPAAAGAAGHPVQAPQSAVPAMWLLPTQKPPSASAAAASHWGVTGGVQRSSRGLCSAALTAAPATAVGQQPDSVTFGASTFMVPSRQMFDDVQSTPAEGMARPLAAPQHGARSPRSPPAWN